MNVLLAGLALTLTACSGTSDEPSGSSPAPTASPSVEPAFSTYVATGDSYSAGPLITTTESNTGCFRSDHNYANLLAQRLNITDFTDVTCSAAETKDYAGRQHTLAGTNAKPQLKAISADTELVTVGIGGNDFGLFQQGIAQGITPTPGTVEKIGKRVRAVLVSVHAKAPDATVVLVGYPRLVDPGTSCPKLLPDAPALLRTAYQVQTQLNAVMRQAARATDTTFVDMFTLSKGHGICSRTPWVNGQENHPGLAAAFHPFVAEMQAAADAVAAAVDQPADLDAPGGAT